MAEQQEMTSSDRQQTEEKRRPLLRPTENQLREARAQLLQWAAAAAKAGTLVLESRLLRAAEELREAEMELTAQPEAQE